jgi:hypothetical protein
MKSTRIAGGAAGLALFYCTFVGVCQAIPGQTATTQPSAREASAEPKPAVTPGSSHMSIGFIATGLKKGGPPPKVCQDILAIMLPLIQAYPHPNGWTWFVACDEQAWVRIQRHEGNDPTSGILAITNRPARATIIRGSAMLHAYDIDYRAQPEHIIAHELCHIYLQSSDESKVDDLATKWLAERKAKKLATLTP